MKVLRLMAILIWAFVAFSDVAAAQPLPTDPVQCNDPYYRRWPGAPPDATNSEAPKGCEGAWRCYTPTASGWDVKKVNPSCDPGVGSGCQVELVASFNVKGAGLMFTDANPPQTPVALWFAQATAPTCSLSQLLFPGGCGEAGGCGFGDVGGYFKHDAAETSRRFGPFTCSTATTASGTYSVRVYTCPTASCGRQTVPIENMTLTVAKVKQALGCPVPPPDDCNENPKKCVDCKGLANGGGGPPPPCSMTPGSKGMSCTENVGATIGYRAGGVGGTGFPGTGATLDWRTRLGRNWSHTYATRVVKDNETEGIGHVWLLTEGGSFREFNNLQAGSGLRRYLTTSPTDEFRVLYYDTTSGGWQLKDLGGAVHVFSGPDGLWDRTILPSDPTHPIQSSYTGGALGMVTFPDGRRERFTYYPSGRLAKLEKLPIGGGPGSGRSWDFRWSESALDLQDGFDLLTLKRPDGTVLEYTYGDAANPGFITRIRELGTDLVTGRIVSAFEYNSDGFVAHAWANDPSFTGPNSVGKQEFTYVGLPLPTQVTMTEWTAANDGTGQPRLSTTTWDIARDTGSSKPKITKVVGECSVCGGIAPETSWEYTHTTPSPNHPLLPSAMLEKRDVGTRRTEYSYTPVLTAGPFLGIAAGTLAQKREAVGNLLARSTSMTYDTNFPNLVTRIERPSTEATFFRRTDFTYDPVKATRLTQTLTGREALANFTYQTNTSYNASGKPELINPANPGTGDQVQFTYNVPNTNAHLPDSRIDPHVGATSFAYDLYNRRTTVTDPNGVATVTTYDDIDRVTKVTRVGFPSPSNDLVTEYFYDCPGGSPVGFCGPFRDLRCMKFPEGNAVRNFYDSLGRVIAVERAAGCAHTDAALERTAYTLDLVGHRVSEELQRPNGAGGWITESKTNRIYKSRCHVDTMTQGADSATPSTTDYCYDPNGNLTGVWDALHPKGTFPTLPSTSYEYDILDRLTAVRQPWVPGGANEKASTLYEYDVQDHLKKVTDAEGNITTYTTSDRDLMTQQNSPVSGVTNYTYNPHGALLTTADARGITVTRQVDELDRVKKETYPDPRLMTDYLYDDNVTPGTDFFKGRLKSITRNGETIAYTYDRFGRMLRDGDLTNVYDKNGRKTQINYPNGVQANFTAFDVADRPLSMTVSGGGLAGTTTVVSGATYKPGGPLTTLTLGNGLTENRFFDARYFPDRIQVPGKIDWDYTVDAVGNVTQIADGSTPRVYGYRDYQYFLTSGSGPWTGPLAWTYDKIGNRLTETRAAVTDTYNYVSNGIGRNPKLSTIVQGVGGTKTFAYDAIGDEARVFGAAAEEERIFDDAGRITRWVERTKNEGTTFRYDGRGFLRESKQDLAACNPLATFATYSSAGLLMHRRQTHGITTATTAEDYVLYFAGRPVAQLTSSPGPSKLTWLTTDHLGTPVLSTLAAPAQTTSFVGGFEPFGRDWNGAQIAGMFLRFPGQWEDPSWSAVSGGSYYNVFRWYQRGIGRYERRDPLAATRGHAPVSQYLYANAGPLRATDAFGLAADVAFGDGAWGSRPDGGDCDTCLVKDRAERRIPEIVSEIWLTGGGASTSGQPGSTNQDHIPRGGGWMEPQPSLDVPFEPGCDGFGDPCLSFCCRVHEWFHRTDRRWWHIDWSILLYATHTEVPAYQLEQRCLASFY